MLVLRKGPLPAAIVDLGAGATARVRPATAFEVDRASYEVSHLLVGMIAGEEAAAAAALALGEEFRAADFADAGWRAAAAQRLSLLKLSVLCCESWDGIGDEAGNPLDLSEQGLALLLRNPVLARRFSEAVEAAVNVEYKEKNVSAASPNGAAAAADPTAPNVVAPASDALQEAVELLASAAPRQSTLQ